jgi:hypothetical protein
MWEKPLICDVGIVNQGATSNQALLCVRFAAILIDQIMFSTCTGGRSHSPNSAVWWMLEPHSERCFGLMRSVSEMVGNFINLHNGYN